jgi:mRNA interferase RelE/StbE
VHQIRIQDAASRELAKLDTSIARRIVNRINWLAKNLDDIRLEPLSGDLSGFYKLRAGDYRVLYQIVHDQQMIVIHAIGHRREVYKRR